MASACFECPIMRSVNHLASQCNRLAVSSRIHWATAHIGLGSKQDRGAQGPYPGCFASRT
jgi:hypothetical protein